VGVHLLLTKQENRIRYDIRGCYSVTDSQGKMNSRLCKGQPAPMFEVETIGGKRIHLQDLRGKIVLLSFWASWCGEYVADIPMLKELHKEFGSDERFTMIGLSLDRST